MIYHLKIKSEFSAVLASMTVLRVPPTFKHRYRSGILLLHTLIRVYNTYTIVYTKNNNAVGFDDFPRCKIKKKK